VCLSKFKYRLRPFEKTLVNQRTAGAFSPHSYLFAIRQLHLKRRGNFLRDTILEIENIVYAAIVAIAPQMVTVQAVNQLRRQAQCPKWVQDCVKTRMFEVGRRGQCPGIPILCSDRFHQCANAQICITRFML